MLVCLAETLAQLQANLLLATSGKTSASFTVLDLERLPLGILSGIGFIGAGVIIKRDDTISGVTTAATIWFVTVLGLLFGGGQLGLGMAAGTMAIAILWGLRSAERLIPRRYSGDLCVTFSSPADEEQLRATLKAGHYKIKSWSPRYRAPGQLAELRCTVTWKGSFGREPHTPAFIPALSRSNDIASLS